MEKILLSNRNPSGKTVVALGKFDGIHKGHIKLLKRALEIAQRLDTVSLVYVMEPEYGEKLTQTDEKKKIIAALGIDVLCTEHLTQEFMSMSPESFVSQVVAKKLNACHVVVGYNFCFGKNRSGDCSTLKHLCENEGIAVDVIDCVYVSDKGRDVAVSSSEIRRLANGGDVEKIKTLLGRNYSVRGMVEHGKHLGRTINFPTANIYREKRMFALKFGVYKTIVSFDGKSYDAITNVGINPTVDTPDEKVRIESYIKNFDGDIYGKEISVEFCTFLREEKKFSSLKDLKIQLQKDKNS